jgi:hypothetical protein
MPDDVQQVQVEDLDPKPKTVTVTLRGVKYVFRECTMKEYEKAIKQAEVPAPGGRGTMTDNVLLLKLLVMRSISEPADMTIQRLAALPMPVGRKINDIVNDMHYGDEPSDEEAAEAAARVAAADTGAEEDDGDPEVPSEPEDDAGTPPTS